MNRFSGMGFIVMLLVMLPSWLSSAAGERAGFIKLDAQGKVVSAKAGPWACVLEQDTGLIWEVKSPQEDGRYKKSTYSFAHPDFPNISVANRGTCFDNHQSSMAMYHCDLRALVSEARSKKLCGVDSWRLPERQELQTLIDHDALAGKAKINRYLFPHTWRASYWTQTPDHRADTPQFYAVNFASGQVLSIAPDRAAAARLVATKVSIKND